ncbi:hypothetical protein LB467_16745 [Salegentibacter sp. JZCK2]|uniref:hypothetical protein n=1 Tax=Salegentibacter tibetensis TaxID=2873600 RepID=UPI001CC8F852|nr:hypothetical protein [Salegentibacter tibetensis]MBZ9731339.1 hypothetical protein [Salegentibacter tibetensis]
MLKNKASLYLLLPLVVIIWGIVIYKVVGAFGDETVVMSEAPGVVGKEIIRVKKDTFSLLPIDRDPFLGHYYKKPDQSKSKPVFPVEKVEWPEVSYLGLISDTGESSKVHILQINGRQFLIEKGGTAEEIKIIASGPEKVTLLFRGDRKTFSKNN